MAVAINEHARIVPIETIRAAHLCEQVFGTVHKKMGVF